MFEMGFKSEKPWIKQEHELKTTSNGLLGFELDRLLEVLGAHMGRIYSMGNHSERRQGVRKTIKELGLLNKHMSNDQAPLLWRIVGKNLDLKFNVVLNVGLG